MIHEKLGQRFKSLSADRKTVQWKRTIVREAAGLIAISESTKEDMVDYLAIPPERIRVIYLSSSMKKDLTLSLDVSNVNKKPYLLYVGNRDIYKNFIPFLTAVAPVLKQYNMNLICAGGKAFNSQEQDLIRAYGLAKLVEQHPVTDQILAQLYSQAVAFVFPSLYEGFGIPILEAMGCGCPCLLSSSSSLPEVGGDAALYFNPDDVNDMRSVIVRLIDDEHLRGRLSERGLKRSATFSWERTVRETLALYADVLT